MRASFIILGVLATLIGALPGNAYACKPAANFRVESVQTDAPDCLSIDGGGSYDNALLDVMNGCELAVTIEQTSCEGCQMTALELAMGESGTFVLEDRENERATTRQELRWSTSEAEGNVQTEVYYENNDDACSPYGCSVASDQPSQSPVLWVTLVLGFIGLRRKLR